MLIILWSNLSNCPTTKCALLLFTQTIRVNLSSYFALWGNEMMPQRRRFMHVKIKCSRVFILQKAVGREIRYTFTFSYTYPANSFFRSFESYPTLTYDWHPILTDWRVACVLNMLCIAHISANQRYISSSWFAMFRFLVNFVKAWAECWQALFLSLAHQVKQ